MSNMWLREIRVRVAGIELESVASYYGAGLDIEFRVEFDSTPDPALAEIDIYNLSRSTENKIRVGETLILNAGYKGDVATLMAGRITSVYGIPEGVDRVTRIEVVDATEEWLKMHVQKSYKPGIKASQILGDLLAMSGLEIGKIDLPHDVTYPNGRSVNSPLRACTRQMVRDCGADLYINNGAIFVVPKGWGKDVGVLLRHDTGLLESPTRVDSDDGREWSVRSLLNHRIRAGTLVKIESKTANGIYKVVKGVHRATDVEFITEMEVATP